ncbi:MAG: carboxypeptidase regulatory-like domain-containing protein [Clostridia bacterium]|nr:carboxypeptidase regulatory-like domain-containing protein [Clostridia bacterium]
MKKLIALALSFIMLGSVCNEALAAVMTLPKKVQTIDERAFYGDTSMDEVVMPYGSENIGELAFAYSGLKRITIPNTVSYIADNAFEGITGLTIAAPAGSKAQEYAEAQGFLWENSGSQYSAERIQAIADLANDPDATLTGLRMEPLELCDESSAANAEQLAAIREYNAAAQEFNDNLDEYNEDADAFYSAIEEMATVFEGNSIDKSGSSILFNDSSMQLIMDQSIEESANFSVAEAALDEEDGTILLTDDRGKKYYLYAEDENIYLTKTKPKSASRSSLLPKGGLTSRASGDLVYEFESRLNWLEKAYQPVDRLLNEHIARVAADLNRILRSSMKDPTNFDLTLQGIRAKDSLNRWTRVQTILNCCEIPAQIANMHLICQNWKEVLKVYAHGHPTVNDITPEAIETARSLNIDCARLLMLYKLDGFYSLVQLGTAVATLGVLSKANMPPSVKELSRLEKWANVVFSVIADLILNVAEDNRFSAMVEKHKKLHTTISGVVTDKDTKMPLQYVHVVCGPSDEWTDSNGYYEIHVTPLEYYTLTYTLDRYKRDGMVVVLSPGQTMEKDVKLEHVKGTLRGRIVDEITEEPLSGVTISNESYKTASGETVPSGRYTATTDKDGRYSLRIPAEELIRFTFTKSKYAKDPFSVSLSADEELEYDTTMKPTVGVIRGRVVDAETEGKVYDNVTVAIGTSLSAQEAEYTVQTKSDGSFSLEVPAGVYVVQAVKEGYTSMRYRIPIPELQGTEWEIKVYAEDGRITGRVIDKKTRAPLDEAVVSFPGGEKYAVTQTDGLFAFTVRSDATFTLIAYKEGYAVQPHDIYVPDHGEATYVFEMEAETGTITGTVVDESGAALSGVTVTCGDKTVPTDSQGRFELEAPAGGVTVRFSKNGYSAEPITCEVSGSGTTSLGSIRMKKTDEEEDDEIVGSTVYFGRYEQDNDLSNGKERIQWRILARDGDYALLLSEYGLDAQPYNTEYVDITWAQCTLRSWLNGTFMSAAFNASEQAAIRTTLVDNSQSQGYAALPGFTDHYSVTTTGGVNTQDKVFLLSVAEAYRYLGGVYRDGYWGEWWYVNNGMTTPTAYAKAQGAWTYSGSSYPEFVGDCSWWLRSPGYDDQCSAAYVNRDGSLGHLNFVDDSDYAVRPALWVNLNSGIF